MSLTLDDLFASPDHYLHSFESGSALFVPMDRAAYHRSIFLDGRISPASSRQMRLPLNALTGRAPRPAPTVWIFHVAHCGSTLLARALDDPATNLVLREPLALRQLALSPNTDLLALTAATLSKRYRADLPTMVKANVPVNFLLPELAALDPDARAIFLYCGLRDYLLAILRSEDHRSWLRRVTAQLAAHLGDLSALSDAERAAALWIAQLRAFAAAAARLPNARTLDAETFFASPRLVLEAAAVQLGVPLSAETLDATVAGSLFSTYSKNPGVAFDNEARVARRAALAATLDAELAQAEDWIARRHGDASTVLDALVSAQLGR
jgi:hypothetical protein